MNISNILETLMFVLLLATCQKEDTGGTIVPINPGNDPNFTIVAHTDAGFTATNRKVDVFGIPIYAFSAVEDSKLLHAANLMAQYLDNDEDGNVDNPTLLVALIDNEAALFLWKSESEIEINAQDLGADETIPAWHINGQTGRFDVAIEEIWHVITHSGYANAYPNIFGENAGTSLANAMDIARGGHFTSIPNPYPMNAWYSYDDQTCSYECMTAEYFYWAMTSILGAQENRLSEIQEEWDLNTKEKVEQTDVGIYQLLTDPVYKFPTVLPDGTYKH